MSGARVGVERLVAGEEDAGDLVPVFLAVEHRLVRDQIFGGEDVDRIAVEIHAPAAFERALVQRIVGEEQIDRGLLPEHSHLLVARDALQELRVVRRRTQRAEHREHALRFGRRQEDVDVDVVGGPDTAVVAEGLRAPECVRDVGADERVFDRDDLLVEQHPSSRA